MKEFKLCISMKSARLCENNHRRSSIQTYVAVREWVFLVCRPAVACVVTLLCMSLLLCVYVFSAEHVCAHEYKCISHRLSLLQ